MKPNFRATDRSILVDALSDIPQFRTDRERQTFIRMVLSEYPFGDEADKTLKFLDWVGPALVVADNLVRLLEGQEVAPGLLALQVIARAIEPIAGMDHREQLAGLQRRLGWVVAPPGEQTKAGADTDAKRARGDFDVFLCHNSKDKPAVLRIAEMLLKKRLLPWLDVWDLQPGMRWQPAIERQIDCIKAAAVFVGNSGFGPWQDEEASAILSRFKERNRPVIPVILEDAVDPVQFPLFLDGRTTVDFRKKEPDPLNQLVFGITGRKTAL